MKTNKATHEELLRLEKSLLDPSVRKSVAEINKLLADEFIEFGKSGKIHTKSDEMKGLPTGEEFKYKMDSFQSKQLAKDVVLVTYKITIKEKIDRTAISSLRSSIWKLIKNRWQIVFHQGTLTSN